MEGALAFFDSRVELLAHDVKICVVGELEVVDACHDTREIVIRRIRWFARLADHREHRRQALESYYFSQYLYGPKKKKKKKKKLTSDRQLGTASGELEEIPTFRVGKLAHHLKEILDALAIHIVAMVCLDGIHES